MSAITHLLNRRYTQSRVTRRQRDGRGGLVDIRENLRTAIPGRVSSLSGSERSRGQREEAYYTHVFFADPPLVVRRGDRLIDEQSGRVFVVVSPRHLSIPDHHVEAEVEEIEEGT